MKLKHPTIPGYEAEVPDSPKRVGEAWKKQGWLPESSKRAPELESDDS